jgi:hypothetical protein
MAKATLILGDTTLSVPVRPLVAKCSLFAENPSLAVSPYRVKSSAALDVFQQFLEAIEDKKVEVTNENIAGLAQLCEEFGFWSLLSKISAFQGSSEWVDSVDSEGRSRMLALEERVWQQERRLAAREAKQSRLAQVPPELSQMQTDLARVTSEVQTTLAQLWASSEESQEQLCREVERLQSEISGMQAFATYHVCRRDIEAMRHEAKADAAALRSEVGQLRKVADAAKRLAQRSEAFTS